MWIDIALFPLLGLWIYSKCLSGPLIFDDHDSIQPKRFDMAFIDRIGRVFLRSKNWRQWAEVSFRQLTGLSYAVNVAGWGSTRALHVGNVLLHAGNAVLAMAVAGALGSSLPRLAGLMFLVHPLAVSSAAYITGRATLLSTGLGLLSVNAMLLGYPGLALLPAAFSILAKEDAIAFFPLISLAGLSRGIPGWWMPLGIPLVYALLKRKSLLKLLKRADRALIPGGLPGNLGRLENALVVWTETVLHLPRWAIGFAQSPYHGSGIRYSGIRLNWAIHVFAYLAVFLVEPLTRLPLLLFWYGPWLIYLVARVPDALMEYRNYSSLLGLALLTARFPALAVFIPFLAVLTSRRSAWWSTSRAFWKAAIARGIGEKSRAHQELGATYRTDGRQNEAVSCFEQALRLNPNLAAARFNLAWCYAETKRFDEAIALFDHPSMMEVPSRAADMGRICEMANRLDDALQVYRRALVENPADHRIVNRLGMLMFIRGNADEGAKLCEEALRLENEHAYRYNCCVIASARKSPSDLARFTKGLPNPLTLTSEMLVRR